MVDDGLFSDTVDVSSVLSEDSGPSDLAAEGGRARAYVSDRGVEVELGAGAEPVLVSAGASGKSAPAMVPLGTGYCVAWCEGGAETGILKLRGLTADGAVFGSEMSIETGSFDHHSLAVSSFGSDGSTAGVSVAWVADAGDGSGFGRIVLQRFSLGFDDDGTPAGLTPIPADHRSASGLTTNGPLDPWLDTANDNTVEIAALGREPVVDGLLSGDTLITWIGDDEHLHGALVAAPASDDAPEAVSSAHASEFAVLNAALADLGPVAPAEAGQRRVKSLELGLGQIALMWLALGSSAIELRGAIITLPDDSGGDAAGGSSVTGLAPIALPPGFDGTFAVAGPVGDGDLAVTYGDAQGGATTVRVVRLETDTATAGPDGTGHEGSATGGHQFVSTSDAGTSARSVEIALDEAVESHSSGTGSGSPAPAAAGSPAAEAGGRIAYFTVAGGEGDDGEDQTAPVVTATAEGFAAAWQVPSEDGQSTGVKLALFSSAAAGASAPSEPPAVFEVTDNADPGVAPAITGTNDGAAIAWVETGESESQLIVEVFEPEQGGTGSVVVDSGDAGGYSGVSMTSQTVDPEAAGGYEEQVAVVWVENADDEGYGSVNLQRYGVPKHDDGSAPAQPVALGADGATDGSNDPAQVTCDDEPVVGRDPQAAGLSSGDLAVIWVERDSSGKGGSIQGVILKGEEKGEGTHLSLKSLMPFGVADGTKPIVFATAAGDISVAWLEPTTGEEDRGYDLKVAAFAPDESDGWVQPSTALSLYHFADKPDDFSLAVSGSDASTLVATWRGDGNELYVQQFGLDGGDDAAAVEVTTSPQTESDTSSAAVLGDGRVVVLYTDHQGSDVDVKAGVIDFACPPDTTDSPADYSGAGTASPSSSETATAAAAVLPDFVGFADDAAAAASLPAPDASSGPGSGDPDWSGYTASGPGPADDASDGISAKTEGEPVILDPLANAKGNGLHVTAVNGVPISPEAPVDVGTGFVQLRDDGKLLFSPDLDFSGEAQFHFTLADDSGRTAQSEARIEVVAAEFSDALFGDDYGFNFDAWTKPEKQNDGSEGYFSESSLAASANEDSAFDPSGQHDYDLLVFKPGFGSDVISDFHGAPEEIIDISSFGYATFQALVEAGALMQVGDDVLITLTPSEPATSDKILLKSYALSSLAPDDFKFS